MNGDARIHSEGTTAIISNEKAILTVSIDPPKTDTRRLSVRSHDSRLRNTSPPFLTIDKFGGTGGGRGGGDSDNVGACR
jgi:hypothetical protein